MSALSHKSLALCGWFTCGLILSVAACSDPVAPSSSPLDMSPPPVDQAPLPMEDMSPAPDMSPEPDMSPDEPVVGWLELSLNPSRGFYTRAETPEIELKVYDLYGQELTEVQPTLEVFGGVGAVEGSPSEGPLSLVFEAEGEGALEACVRLGEVRASSERVCIRRALVVDDAPPSVEVLWPPRGAQLSAFDAPPFELSAPPPDDSGAWLPVVAQIEDGQRAPIVRLNGVVVELNEGRLETYLPARFGYQRVELSVDDGVRYEETSDARWVLWAHDYLPFEAARSALTDGLMLSLNQDFLDQDSAIDLNANPLRVGELAQLVELLLGLINPLSLLPAQTLSNTSSLRLVVSDLTLGEPWVDVSFHEGGLTMYLELNGLTLTTSGHLDLGADRVSLNGALSLDVAAYADFELGTNPPNEALTLTSSGSGVTITALEADLESASAEALVEALNSQARSLVVSNIEGLLDAVIRDELPPMLEQSVNSIFSTIRYLPLELNANIEGVTPLSLALEVTPSHLNVDRQRAAELWCDAQVTHLNAPIGPGEGVEQRGVPLISVSEPPEQAAAFVLYLQQNILNALLSEVWRGGLLSLTPPLPPETSALVSTAQLTALTPPVLSPAEPGERYPLYLEVGALKLELSGPLAPEVDEFEVYARVGAELVVEGGAFVIALEESPHLEVRLTKQRNQRPVLSTLILERVIAQSIWPMLSEGLTSQLRIGLEEAPLDVRALRQLGVALTDGRVTPSFNPELITRGGWLTLLGELEVTLTR